MKVFKLVTLPVLIAVCVCASPLSAQVRVNKITWQTAKLENKKKLPFETVSEIRLAPYQKFQNKLRAVVTAQNVSAKPVEGLVLRCAVSLRMNRLGAPAAAGFWAVPFRVEELRISQIKPSGIYEAKFIHFELAEQLKKLKNTGFWVDAIKLSVMLDPKPGDDPAAIMLESVVEIKAP